jgi:transposase
MNRPGMSGDFIGWLEDEVMGRPSRYPRELRERAVRAVAESVAQGESASEFVAIRTIAHRLGIASPETLRRWVRQAEVDQGSRPGKTTEELAEIRELKKEVAELRRANQILKSASAFFAAELDRQPR